ncbi:MAG: exodeoxyribonuclease III [Lentisphaerae bacterium]|nr:exodeoxyribonuclease III [Lentisphaerota bacterium]
MRIATFNANSVRVRLPIILEWLQAYSPDILCIQETKVQDKDFPADAFMDCGYHVTFKGQKTYNGVAVVSRTTPTAVRFGFDDDGPTDETRLADVSFGALHIVNTYVPQGREISHEMYPYKLEWFERLKAYFETHFTPRKRVIWLGDLNVAPEAIDVHNAPRQQDHVCHHVAVREAFAETVAWGFTDVFRLHHPEPGQYTFYDFRAANPVEQNKGWRVDHILATRSLVKKCSDSFIDLEPRKGSRPSDHTFLVADFNL